MQPDRGQVESSPLPPIGWSQRGRWTLRFADPDVERAYQEEDREEGARRAQTASLVAACNWVAVALLGPSTLGIQPESTWLICSVMVAFLLACAVATRWADTPTRRDAIGIGQQIAAAVAVVALTTVTGTFPTYAMPGLMLTAVFGFAVTRPPFVGAVALGAFYPVAFAVTGLWVGMGRELLLQIALLMTTVIAASVGAYLLERSQRDVYGQSRLVAMLHDRVDRLLHQYLSPDIASTLIDDPARAALGGQVVDVTVLFADLRGYTAFAEQASPAEVVAMLNTAFGATVPLILLEGGTVVQFMGDALMAVFNAPRPQPDHALRAARAALAMQRAIDALPALEGPAADHARPRFRVGLNSGPALVGNIGAAEIRNYSAIGDTTNLAARLQAFAAEGSVVMGTSTYERIRDEAIVRALGTPELKGKSVPVAAYELLGLRESVDA